MLKRINLSHTLCSMPRLVTAETERAKAVSMPYGLSAIEWIERGSQLASPPRSFGTT